MSTYRTIVVSLLALVMVACIAGSPTQAEALKIALVLPDVITDLSWNAVAYQGLEAAAKDLGVEFTYQERVADADVERVLRDYADQGYDFILAESFNYQDATIRVAKDYPDIMFATATGFKTQEAGFEDVPPNHAVYDWPAHQVGYLTGMLAAYMSENNHVGFVGGYEVPDIVRQAEGYKDGARAVNPDIKVGVIYTGSWVDTVKGQEAAISLIDLGADVIAQAADGPGVGAILACQSRDVYAIGYVADQNHVAPETVLTSVLLVKETAYRHMIQDIQNGEFESKAYLFDLIDGGVDLAPYHGLVPEEIQQKIQQATEDILSGKLVVEERLEPTK
ncbi:BMP family ABC transporter substrate-binding protein [candidate division KSB3 bacterium]|uniref:BMP family ABC transporter substrate-binding protein n=1 Tax=candidate division KSB3 bacterium TaxID=2044937 RepID=A0A9D5Q3Y3_9BACT|nr:BMP family ABC transporter substrate-binding protein [candidate division KSB3 bacterium]MBD3322980.1 BMP family ABC transporter substrate-binding protein [candidate division KSB3 bacterium]